ncbi:arginine--tRNA ligase [Caldiplasma sukawensis]
MLLFENIKEKLVKLSDGIFDLTIGDIEFDNTGHTDIAIKTFRLADRKNFQEEIKIYMEKLKNFNWIKEANLEKNYLNIELDGSALFNYLYDEAIEKGLYPEVFQDPERYSVEHTSINPTGPIHMGRVRNSIIGDTIVRIIDRMGYRVTSQYYVNDSGKQVVSLYLGYEKFHKGEKPTPEILLDGYRKIYDYFEKTGSEKEAEQIMERYENGDVEIIGKIRELCQIMLDDINIDLSKIGIKIDEYNWESEFITSGETERVLEMLKDELKEDGNAMYIDVPGVRKIYLRRSNGTSLYVTRDVAYHMYKFSNYDRCVVVLGEDHKEHGKIMRYILSDLMKYPNELDFVFYGYVNLPEGKMSTRKGNAIALKDVYNKMIERLKNIMVERGDENTDNTIVENIARSSLRYDMVRINASKTITFDWDKALDFKGNSAPFILYSLTRANSILSKESSINNHTFDDFRREEKDLLVNLYRYPFILMESFKMFRPDILANFCYELATKFTVFYENCRVLGEKNGIEGRRLALTRIYSIIMNDAIKTLGLEKVNKM